MEMFNGREVIRVVPDVAIPMCDKCVCSARNISHRLSCIAPEDIVCWEETESGDCINDCYFIYKEGDI